MVTKDERVYKLILKVNEETLFFTAHNYIEQGNHISFTDKFGKDFEYHKDCLIKKEVL